MEKKALGGTPHTNKELIISNKKKYIFYISKTYQGKEHDYSLLKQEFPSEITWFKEFNVHLDLGFKGFEDLYPCQNLFIPIAAANRQKTKKY